MTQPVVLMIDDDPHSIDRVNRYLDRDMYHLHHTTDPFEGVELAKQLNPDIIILDLRMPQLDGFEVCQRLRSYEGTRNAPIIIYSVVGDEDEAFIRSFNLGAHAVVKKGKLSRLGATLARFLRADEETQAQVHNFQREGHTLKIQADAERVWLDGQEKVLRPLVRRVLACLIARPGITISSEELASEVYGTDWEYSRGKESIHRLIHDLRQKVEPRPAQPLFVISQPRIGYRISGTDQAG